MNKYNIEIVLNKKYIANNYDEAREMAKKDMANIHYLWNAKFKSYTDLGRIGELNE